MEHTKRVPAACDTKKSVSSSRNNTGQKQLFDNGISVYCFNYKRQEKPWLVYKGVHVYSPNIHTLQLAKDHINCLNQRTNKGRLFGLNHIRTTNNKAASFLKIDNWAPAAPPQPGNFPRKLFIVFELRSNEKFQLANHLMRRLYAYAVKNPSLNTCATTASFSGERRRLPITTANK